MDNKPFNEKEVLAKVVSLLDESKSAEKRADLFKRLIPMLRRELCADAVAIRIRDGDDYPYYTTIGFTDHFVQAENFLCDGGTACGLQCMCGTVIEGRVNPEYMEAAFPCL